MAGTIRWEVDRDSISKEFAYSPEVKVGGITWFINMYATSDGQNLSIFLSKKDSGSKVFTVDVEYKIMLINHADMLKTITKEGEKTFDSDSRSWGYRAFSKWDIVMDAEKGFLKDNKITVQADFLLSNIIESRVRRRVDCADSSEPSHDLTLVVEDKMFYVSRSYLSIVSPVFHSMLYGNFDEKKKNVIELKDIDAKEFGVLINVIYPPHEKISDENYAYLLKLGDYYDIDMVFDKVEQFLIDSAKLTVSAKLVLAGQYRLCELQIHCFNELKTIKDITDVKKKIESKGFTDAINLALLDKIVKLTV